MTFRLTPPPAREFPETRLQQRKEQLLSQIQAESHQPLRQPEHGRRWVLALGAVAAAAAVAIAVVAVLPAGSGGPTPAAAAVLNRLARLVAAQPLTPQPSQYLYMSGRSDYGAFSGNCETRAVDYRQIWFRADGSGLIRDTSKRGYFTSPADRATCLRMARKYGQEQQLRHQLAPGTNDQWFAPNCLQLKPNVFAWSSLSSDPRVLLQQMRRLDGGPPTAGEDFVHVGDFLRETGAPPAVRATIYRAAALIPGVRLLGTVRDHDGRPGLGVAYTYSSQWVSPGVVRKVPKSTNELIFNAQTGELLGEEQTGSAGYWAVYFPDKVVNRLPSKPPAPLNPPCTKQGEGGFYRVPGGNVVTGPHVKSR